jgi:ribonucleoside-triphosphate reductase
MWAAKSAAFIGTLQAGYTDFHYLRPIWQQTTEEEALIGVGITGIGANKIKPEWLPYGATYIKAMNAEIANAIGIKAAARTTTVKPSGTSSLVLGSSSGVHAYHNDYYIRRMRFGKDEAILQYLEKVVPELIEDCKEKPATQSVLSIPQRSPQGGIVRTEAPLQLLERVALYNAAWVREGHCFGDNYNNVSCTISLKDEDWNDVGEWMWANKEIYNGISVLPYDGGTYVQPPFEDCSEGTYRQLLALVNDIDLTKVSEASDNTSLAAEAACAGDGCVVI